MKLELNSEPEHATFYLMEPDESGYPFTAFLVHGLTEEERIRRRDYALKAVNCHADLLAACKVAAVNAKAELEALGSCEHDVNICYCGLKADLDTLHAAILRAEKGDGR